MTPLFSIILIKIQESSTIIMQHKWGFNIVLKWRRLSLRERVWRREKNPFSGHKVLRVWSCTCSHVFLLSTCTGLLLELLTLLTFVKFKVLLGWNNSRILAGTYYSQNYSRIIGTGVIIKDHVVWPNPLIISSAHAYHTQCCTLHGRSLAACLFSASWRIVLNGRKAGAAIIPMQLARVAARTVRGVQLHCEAWSVEWVITAYYWLDTRYAPRVLHFSAFHYNSKCSANSTHVHH